jgi:hypothetical protein
MLIFLKYFKYLITYPSQKDLNVLFTPSNLFYNFLIHIEHLLQLPKQHLDIQVYKSEKVP